METVIAYFDETGDDGLINYSSQDFVLTSICTKAETWKKNYNVMKSCRVFLKEKYGFHATIEMHTKNFLTDKTPYRDYGWTKEQKREILTLFTNCIAEQMDIFTVNVVIDKTKIADPDYDILEHALIYNIQQIENSSVNNWNYIIITDKGRIAPMRRTSRALCSSDESLPEHFAADISNKPVKGLIEDILEKDSSESFFIQVSDFISYFSHLYFKCVINKNPLPSRVQSVIDTDFIIRVMEKLKNCGKLNLSASKENEYGLAIYPK